MNQCKKIMIQGTMSGAGKSLLVTALCRIFREDGLRAAPFKSQNMALNSYITKDGLEIGRAQAAQAEAAGLLPDVRMNPILLKPTSDIGSQLIVNGRVRGTYRAAEYFRMKKQLIPDILAAYESLASENDVIVIEGAGSPAEINLKADDIVNMGLAELVDAPVALVGDIDPGGVFAQLFGTIMLLPENERARIVGTIINKFRGDAAILRPGLGMLKELTGVPVLGVVPYTDVDIDDEDSLSRRLTGREHDRPVDVAVIRTPRIANFTDITPLTAHPALGVRYVGRADAFGDPDLVILPGTKNTMDDLAWLRESGLEARIIRHASASGPVLGICGGYQMLGEVLSDPDGHESGKTGYELRGLGLLPTSTVFCGEKIRRQTELVVKSGPFAGARLTGYEIHMGRTRLADGAEPFARKLQSDPADSEGGFEGCRRENVFGTYLHGLFDTGELTEKLAAYLLERKGLTPKSVRVESRTAYKERQYDRLAAVVRESLDMEAIYRAMR